MYLKSLKLVGFKSFADRTRLELRPGVTVIVGPNGSGKSNLVDAVSWVMGTQSAKGLRTGRMEDVVFGGTATRPALNRAEVTLVLDNASRAIPLDLDEVAVTRRLYRDGSSDYELNGVDCRLIDVQELLSDSGVGRHQHVIVGQGQIESVLSSGPSDHRAVIEEAAGILKHRQRKDRALRRLERTDADVVRLGDLLGELGRQMRPLRRQAAAAEAHAGATARMREMRLFMAGERLRQLDTRTEVVGEEAGALTRAVADGEAQVMEMTSVLSILTTEADAVGRSRDRDTAAAARLETILEKLGRLASVAQERHRTSTIRRESAQERRQDLSEELAGLAAEAAQAEAEALGAATVAQREERRFRTLEDEARSLVDQERLTAEGALAVGRAELRSLEAAHQRDLRESDQITRRTEIINGQIEAETEEISRINQEIRAIDSGSAELQRRYEVAVRSRGVDQAAWEAVEAEWENARLQAATAGARLEALEGAAGGLADSEGRRLVETVPGSRGSLVSLLGTPPELAPAVEAALGGWADATVFRTDEAIDVAVHRLKTAGQGGLSLVWEGLGAEVPARRAAGEAGVEALVDRLAPAGRALAGRVLGDVLLVETWAEARRIIGRHPTLRAVTPEGDLVGAGQVRAAEPDGAGPAILEAAAAALERAETALARVESRRLTATRQFERSRSIERQALEELEGAEARLAGAAEAMGRLERSRSHLGEERGRLAERLRALGEAGEERRPAMERLSHRLEALEGEEAERQRAWQDMEARRDKVEADREASREAWQHAAAEARAAEERRSLLESRRREVVVVLEDQVTEPVSEGEVERLSLVEQSARTAVARIAPRLEELRARQADLRTKAAAAASRRHAVEAGHEEARAAAEAGRRRLGELAVEAAELRARRESVCEGLRRQADADEQVALRAPRPHDWEEGPDPEAVLADLEARLRRMGPVNPLAAEEYHELEDRHRFLSDQLADLESSRAEVRKVVSALDEEISRRFAAAFEAVATAYQRHFAVLFPGGQGRLRLTDSDDPLEAGVEIEAQPIGKKVSRLTLLSGGERSLAALAFLFGVFEARPSPFYILDEVEAALDDANLRRFLRLVDSFRSTAQMVIVTHQQQTMQSANVLYGVTMEPGGSSTVVRREVDPLGGREGGVEADGDVAGQGLGDRATLLGSLGGRQEVLLADSRDRPA